MTKSESEDIILRAAEAILRVRARALQDVAVPHLSTDQTYNAALDSAYAAACGFAAADELAHFVALVALLESEA